MGNEVARDTKTGECKESPKFDFDAWMQQFDPCPKPSFRIEPLQLQCESHDEKERVLTGRHARELFGPFYRWVESSRRHYNHEWVDGLNVDWGGRGLHFTNADGLAAWFRKLSENLHNPKTPFLILYRVYIDDRTLVNAVPEYTITHRQGTHAVLKANAHKVYLGEPLAILDVRSGYDAVSRLVQGHLRLGKRGLLRKYVLPHKCHTE